MRIKNLQSGFARFTQVHFFQKYIRKSICLSLICMLAIVTRDCLAAEEEPLFIITSPKHTCVNPVVVIPVPSSFANKVRASHKVWELQNDRMGDSGLIPCQFQNEDGKTTLSFLLPDIRPGEKLRFRLHASSENPKTSGLLDRYVKVAKVGSDIEIKCGDQLFTRYTTHSGPNKPFFYPLLTPDSHHLTRRWPVEPDADPTESHDHPHHRGLWFTHSSVNGVDFWTEVETEKVKLGKTVNTGFSNLISGPVFGEFQATTDWIMPDGKRVATDTRTVHIYPLYNGGRLLDFAITLKPDGGPLVLGDNKDGLFGLRLPDSMAVNPSVKPARPGTGHYVNSVGDKDGKAWGKAAEWVDYWGPVGGQTWGVAMFDDPKNFRHPETWHARDYSLFAVNPLALHDFNLGPKNAGDYTIPANGSLTLHYRLLFHKGDAAEAHIAEQYASFADPPEVEAHWDGKIR